MARRPRLFISDVPYHVLQRGNNKNPIFFSSRDYLFFLEVLQEAKLKHPCVIYGYCLMTNHFHLLIEPKEKENISLLVKLIGSKYVRYVNKAYKRTGTLWEGRFKCCMIERESYFLSCLRYIEMNPVRAGLVNSPELYQWSSYRARAFGEENSFLTLDSWYNNLSSSQQERELIYRRLFQESRFDRNWKLIRELTNRNGIAGNDEFREKIAEITGQDTDLRPAGRPRINEK